MGEQDRVLEEKQENDVNSLINLFLYIPTVCVGAFSVPTDACCIRMWIADAAGPDVDRSYLNLAAEWCLKLIIGT